MSAIRKTVLVALQLNHFNFTIWDVFKKCTSITQQRSDQFDIDYRKLNSQWRQAQCTETLFLFGSLLFVFSFYCFWYKQINKALSKIKTKATQMFIFFQSLPNDLILKALFNSIKVMVAFFFPPSRSDLSIKKKKTVLGWNWNFFPLTVISQTMEVGQFWTF